MVIALAMPACEDEHGVADRIAYVDAYGLGAPTAGAYAGASEILGLELDPWRDGDGAWLSITVVDLPDDSAGATLSTACGAAILLDRTQADSDRTLAHEVGHALGLEHVDDMGNLMYGWTDGGIELTDEQVQTMRESAWDLGRFCR